MQRPEPVSVVDLGEQSPSLSVKSLGLTCEPGALMWDEGDSVSEHHATRCRAPVIRVSCEHLFQAVRTGTGMSKSQFLRAASGSRHPQDQRNMVKSRPGASQKNLSRVDSSRFGIAT
jgi:hypothetical protein